MVCTYVGIDGGEEREAKDLDKTKVEKTTFKLNQILPRRWKGPQVIISS